MNTEILVSTCWVLLRPTGLLDPFILLVQPDKDSAIQFSNVFLAKRAIQTEYPTIGRIPVIGTRTIEAAPAVPK